MKKMKLFSLMTLLCAFFAFYSDQARANDGGGDCAMAGYACGSGIRCCNTLLCVSGSPDSQIGICEYRVGG